MGQATLTGNSKNGMVFMLAGAYCRPLFEKPYYFNYYDIDDITIIPDKKGNISSTDDTMLPTFSNGRSLSIGIGQYYKDNLKELLIRLK